jgi:serine/threonine protein phosphatase PrpC
MNVDMNPLHKGMGCTAEFQTFHSKGFVVGHIGDSRTYRYQGKKLKRPNTPVGRIILQLFSLK